MGDSGKAVIGTAVDRSWADASDVLLGWLTRFNDAGGLLLSISRDGDNFEPPRGWTKEGWSGGLSAEGALARLAGGHNIGAGPTGGMFIIDADNESAIEMVDDALGGVRTLSAWSPRGKQYIFRSDKEVRQIQCKPLGIDTRGSGKGYGMAPGSHRSGKSYMHKWDWDNKDKAQRDALRGTLPSHKGPWFYQVADNVEVAEAPESIFKLLVKCLKANEEAKKRIRKERDWGRKEWELTDLGEMLKHLDAERDGSRDDWLRIVFGAKAKFGDAARELVEAWSAGSAKYDADNFDATWKAASGDAVSFGTVVWSAKQAGWGAGGSDSASQPDPALAAIMQGVVASSKKASSGSVQDDDDDEDDGSIILLMEGNRAQWAEQGAAVIRDYGIAHPEDGIYVASDTVADYTRVDRAKKPKPSDRVKVPEGTLQRSKIRLHDLCLAIGPLAQWGVPAEKGITPRDPKPHQVEFMLAQARMNDWLPVLAGVADGPVMRRDGSVLETSGYDEATGLYAGFDGQWPSVPSNPTQADAKAAGEKIIDVLRDTPFDSDADRGVFLSLVLSVACREYALGGVPAHLITGNNRGAGKGTVAQVAAVIATGSLPTMVPTNDTGGGGNQRSESSKEEKKRLVTLASSGARMVVIDNQESGVPFGNAALDMAMTTCTDETIGILSDRLLGKNDANAVVAAPWRQVIVATGNNLTVAGDMDRRAMMCSLVTPHENPEVEADYSTHPNPVEYARANRKELYMAGITLLRAHHLAVEAGDAKQITPRVASFGGWSDRIRSAIAWALGEGFDPWKTNKRVSTKARPEQEDAIAFLRVWYARFQDNDVNLGRHLEPLCNKDGDRELDQHGNDPNQALVEAVEALPLSQPRGKKNLNVRSLSKWLQNREGRPAEFVVRRGEKHQTWRVVRRGAVVAQERELIAPQAPLNGHVSEVEHATPAYELPVGAGYDDDDNPNGYTDDEGIL